MADDNIHLKLDRLIAGQAHLLARVDERDEIIAAWTAALSVLNESIQTQTETLNRLAEAMSKEGGNEIAKELASIADSLKSMQQDGARMVVLVGRLPITVAQAAQDAVTMALGDGIDIPPEE